MIERTSRSTSPSAQPDIPVVLFRLGPDVYAIPVGQVREVLRPQSVTRVPESPSWLAGVTHVRGRVLPVIELRVRFGLPPAEVPATGQMLVVRLPHTVVVLRVDQVDDAVRLPGTLLQAPPAFTAGSGHTYVAGVGRFEEQTVLVLDAAAIFSEEERGGLQRLQEGDLR